MTLPELLAISSANGLAITKEQAAQLEQYARLLAEWNAKINLISRKDEANIFERHILHSLTLVMPNVCNFDFSNKRIADLGTGGGLPGIPLKIVNPPSQITLIDSIQKKILACEDMISQLKLRGIEAIRGRAEELSSQPNFRNAFDAIISRAAAPLDDLAKWSRNLLKSNGTLIALKGGDMVDEIIATKKLKFISSIETKPLELNGYDGFVKEEKKVVKVGILS